ncbi:MAG: lipoprotein-releasing ABC transporter permease subunit [Rickettsiella sp.]|nr:lipoprotein-releasing ABC transporter permease subunit [Rickettsiella sp.]
MFRPIALYIGLRYTRAKRRNHFISFISLTSMIGIALGVMVLITVLSVMNGFDEEIRSRIFSMATQVAISSNNGQTLSNTKSLTQTVLKQPHVIAVAPFVMGQGMLINLGQPHPILLSGVNPEQEKKVSEIPSKIVEGHFILTPGQYDIVLGEQLATELGINIGDKVNIITPRVALTPAGIMPRFKTFSVSGIFRVGRSFGFESNMAYIAIQDAQTLFELGTGITGLRLKLDDLYAAPKVSLALSKQIPSSYQITDWTSTYGSLMYAISLEKKMMFFILLLLIAISAFNLVSSLMMVVTDKQSDIAILRTLGATPRTILGIFMVQGCIIGLVGTLIGLIAGLLLAFYAGDIVSFLEHSVFHTEILASNVYFFVDKLPSKIEGPDILYICIAALGMSLLATIYPALKAARTAPAEALRYE